MKYLTLPFFVLALGAYAQAVKSAETKPDTVVIKVGGKPVTAAEFERILGSFPPDIQQAAKSDPRQTMQSYYLMQSLGQRALAEKLDQSSPFKEQLELQRMQFLASTLLNRESGRIAVTEEDQKARYETDKADKYDQAKIRVIAILFADAKTVVTGVDVADPKKPKIAPATGVRTEAEAKAVAMDVVKQLRGGADFAALAREKSDDKASAAKGGDFGLVRRVDRVPDDIKQAVFALKPGEVSDPIRQPMGFYVIKSDERTVQPFSEVKIVVANELKQERFKQMMGDMQKRFEVTVEAPDFFGTKPGAPAPAAPAAR